MNPDITSTLGAAATTVDSSRLPSFRNMSEQGLDVSYDFSILSCTKCGVPIFTVIRPILERQNLKQVAFYNETLARVFLPAFEIVWVGLLSGLNFS